MGCILASVSVPVPIRCADGHPLFNNCWLDDARRMYASVRRRPMSERVRGFVYEAAVITGGMAPVALLALALMLD